jgi:beta-alanine degradation protein BauB
MPELPEEDPLGGPLSRREAMQTMAALGIALGIGCLESTPLQARRTIMDVTTTKDAATATPKVAKRRLANDRVRVLEHISNPGDKEEWHAHPAMAVYVVSGGTLRITTADGQTKDVEFITNDVLFREPTTHATENIGKTQLHAILVELLKP